MKILTNKQYNDLLNEIEHKDKSIVDLRDKLIKAENLKEVLEVLANKTGIPKPEGKGYLTLGADWADGLSFSTATWSNAIAHLPDTVLQYTEDILGGKVIKQEGNKCLVITKDGTVKTGLTKAKVDKGYTYKLVRE
jgi:hypothetical protein